ncbi:dihydrolipoamide acetyltransferase family protein [Nocardioides plantarum]|uniref:Dihydrolipoamide acetyltransferase component of pyruvate dehydrogenase complex n=1 Tax=Nocardioides plantarum TaxID=29299 RepID=A0ABV5KGQ4_9ACTN|nr:dihydrolipoamide acetyltransferase family protein [Nocardioides plantarum]
MATLLRIPEVAAGATEVILSEWLVEQGAEVAAGAPVVVVETEKATVEIEAEVTGTVLRRLCEAGETIEVGSVYAVLGAAGEGDAEADALLAEVGLAAAEVPAPEPDEAALDEESYETDQPAPTAEAQAEPQAVEPAEPAADPGRTRIFAAPVARRILAEAGIALDAVTGSGPRGRIMKKDADAAVRAAQEAPAPAPEPTPAPEPEPQRPAAPAGPAAGDGWTDEPHSRLRRLVATRLTQSKQTVPHFYLRRTVRVDALLAVRAQLNAVSPQKISVNDLVVRAVGVASRTVPEANVIWTDDALRRYDTVDVGVAVASERGLMTPVVRGVESLTPAAIARRIRELVEQSSSGTLRQSDLEGGTISVTNLGMFGVEEFDAIINPPQSAILAVGAAAPNPVVVDGRVEVATTMQLVLSVDHRAIDGALGARWLAALVECLEEPFRLLA